MNVVEVPEAIYEALVGVLQASRELVVPEDEPESDEEASQRCQALVDAILAAEEVIEEHSEATPGG